MLKISYLIVDLSISPLNLVNFQLHRHLAQDSEKPKRSRGWVTCQRSWCQARHGPGLRESEEMNYGTRGLASPMLP